MVNTALATAENPEAMGKAFQKAVCAGREAFLAGLGNVSVCNQFSLNRFSYRNCMIQNSSGMSTEFSQFIKGMTGRI